MTTKIYKELIGLGIDKKGALRIERLLTQKATPYERIKWKKLGVLSKDNEVIVSTDTDDKAFAIELVLFDLCWNGLIKRCDNE